MMRTTFTSMVFTAVIGLVWVAPVAAQTFYSQEEALALAFDQNYPVERKREIIPADKMDRIEEISQQKPRSRIYTYYEGTLHGGGKGFAVIDEDRGQYQPITYIMVADADFRCRMIEVMVYREAYGSQIRQPRWRGQFEGKTSNDPFRLNNDIQSISGATLSCRSISNGVRRNLACMEVLLGENSPRTGGGSAGAPENNESSE